MYFVPFSVFSPKQSDSAATYRQTLRWIGECNELTQSTKLVTGSHENWKKTHSLEKQTGGHLYWNWKNSWQKECDTVKPGEQKGTALWRVSGVPDTKSEQMKDIQHLEHYLTSKKDFLMQSLTLETERLMGQVGSKEHWGQEGCFKTTLI